VDWPSYKKISRTLYRDGKTIELGCRISATLTIADGLNHANLSGHEMQAECQQDRSSLS